MTGLSSETTAEQDRLGRRCRLCEHLMMVVGSPKERVQRTSAREHRKSPQAGSNHRPFAYEASALPLSYRGFTAPSCHLPSNAAHTKRPSSHTTKPVHIGLHSLSCVFNHIDDSDTTIEYSLTCNLMSRIRRRVSRRNS